VALARHVALREVTGGDAAALAALYRDNAAFLAPTLPVSAEPLDAPPAQAARLETMLEERARDAAYVYLIEERRAPVGVLSLTGVARGAHQSAYLGYWVTREHNGRGIATAAVGLSLTVAFGSLGLHRLQAATLTDNVASQRVLEKNAFQRIGVAHAYLRIAGRWQDHVLFQRVADE
jgi:ribosomal-protein-alanine N-acetyltransferase